MGFEGRHLSADPSLTLSGGATCVDDNPLSAHLIIYWMGIIVMVV